MTALLTQNMTAWCARFAELLVGSAWKGLVLVACVAFLLRCLPRLGAGVRSVVWTSVLVVVLLLPAIASPGFAWGDEAAADPVSGVVHAGMGWSLLIVAAWGMLSLLRVVQLTTGAWRLRRISRRACPMHPSPVVASLLAQAPRQVRMATSADVSRPSVAGFFRPQILLPIGLIDDLSDDDLRNVVLHELEHLRRRDDWTNLLQKLGLALFPLHPALIWLDRRLCRERELACDDGVLRATQAPKAYAACLARLAEDSMFRRGMSLALGLLGVGQRRSELSGRVNRILRKPAKAMSRFQMRFAAAAVVGGVLAATVLLAHSPRLISFVTSPQAEVAERAPSMTAPTRVVPTAAHLIAAKAVMPQPTANVSSEKPCLQRLTRAVAVNRRSRASLRRVALAQPIRAPESYLVLTAWHEQMSAPHRALAIATYEQPAQISQPTYAAVPVRGGWLLIEL